MDNYNQFVRIGMVLSGSINIQDGTKVIDINGTIIYVSRPLAGDIRGKRIVFTKPVEEPFDPEIINPKELCYFYIDISISTKVKSIGRRLDSLLHEWTTYPYVLEKILISSTNTTSVDKIGDYGQWAVLVTNHSHQGSKIKPSKNWIF